LFPMTSLAAVGEGMIASSLLWLTLFLVLFRTHTVPGAVCAISLAALGALTHESAAVFFVGIAGIAIMRLRGAGPVASMTHLAIFTAATWSAGYLVSAVLCARDPINRGDFLIGMFALAFIEQNGLSLTAVATIVSCFSISRIVRAQNKGEATQPILQRAVIFFVLTAALLLFFPEWTITPLAQFSGRGLPVLGTTALSFGLWWACRRGAKAELLLSTSALLVLCGLLFTQSVAQIMMTRQWAGTVSTVTRIIERSEALVPWQTALAAAAPVNPVLWKEMTWYSQIQTLSLLLAPYGRVHTLIDA